MINDEEIPVSDWSIHAVRKERDRLREDSMRLREYYESLAVRYDALEDETERLRARVAELEAENSKLIEHAIQIEHRLTKEMSGRIDAAREETARECIDSIRSCHSAGAAVVMIEEKFVVTG